MTTLAEIKSGTHLANASALLFSWQVTDSGLMPGFVWIAALYILVAVALAVGIYLAYGQISSSNKTSTLSQQVNTLVANTRALYASSPGFGTGPMNAHLIAAQAAPFSWPMTPVRFPSTWCPSQMRQ